jgi:hypothetical protein
MSEASIHPMFLLPLTLRPAPQLEKVKAKYVPRFDKSLAQKLLPALSSCVATSASSLWIGRSLN